MKAYETPEFLISRLNPSDVIATSDPTLGTETPPIDENDGIITP